MARVKVAGDVVNVDDDVVNDNDGVVNDDDDDYSLLLLSPAKLKLRLRCALSICQK